jgi:hypothetical protein
LSGEKKFEQVLYDLVRCSLLHDGCLPKEIEITEDNKIGVTIDGKVIFSKKLIWGMILSVIGAPVNKDEIIPDFYTTSIKQITLKLNELWGEKEKIYNLVVEHNK